jgi:hypothetical protein
MKISELATELRSQSEAWGRQYRALEQDGLWTNRSSELNSAQKMLHDPVQFLRWASGFDGSPTGIAGLPQLRDVQRRLSKLHAEADRDPAKLLNSPAISETIGAIKRLSEELERIAADRWTLIVRSSEWNHADLWAAYRGNAEHSFNVLRAAELDQIFNQFASQRYLKQTAERERFAKLLTEHQAVIAVLPPVPDDSIRAFIKEAQQGVRLSRVDDEVLRWLRAQNLLDAFIVKYQR